MARRRRHEEHVPNDRWLVSYADFITLLFAFFVVMYSVSSVNDGKYRVLSDSLIAAFRSDDVLMRSFQFVEPVQSRHEGQTVQYDKQAVTDLPPLIAVPRQRILRQPADPSGADGAAGIQHIAREVEQAMAPLIQDGLVAVRRHADFIEVEIKSAILFRSGSARLIEPHALTLQQLAGVLAPFRNLIHVEGHTDNVPIASELYPSNWELSAGRAASVVHLLQDNGVAPVRLSAVGYGEFRPIAGNGTNEERAQNRRVVVVVRAAEAPAPVPGAARTAARGAVDEPAMTPVQAPLPVAESPPAAQAAAVIDATDPPPAVPPVPAGAASGERGPEAMSRETTPAEPVLQRRLGLTVAPPIDLVPPRLVVPRPGEDSASGLRQRP